jgi:hypothetical protein
MYGVATSSPPPEKSAACQYIKYTDVDGFHGNKTASKLDMRLGTRILLL